MEDPTGPFDLIVKNNALVIQTGQGYTGIP
jgi:hypothetical protein